MVYDKKYYEKNKEKFRAVQRVYRDKTFTPVPKIIKTEFSIRPFINKVNKQFTFHFPKRNLSQEIINAAESGKKIRIKILGVKN